jgi:hypothetical protein
MGIQFCEIFDYKKSMITNFFSTLSFLAVVGCGIRDPGWVKIRIRDISATLTTGTSFCFCGGFRRYF